MPPEHTPLTMQERVRATLELGESHFREFKSALEGPPSAKNPRDAKTIRKDIGEALVAFANADGGELLVGVEDDGRVTGVPHSEEALDSFLASWQSQVHAKTPLVQPRVARVQIDGSLVLYFAVQKGTELIHLTSDGRCMQRRDRESRPVPSEHIRFERQERLSREYDRTFIDGAEPSVLDLTAVEKVGEQIAPGLSPEKVLQLLDLAEFSGPGVRLRRAAVLLLGREISHWHPRCEVRILRVAGTELRAGREYNVVQDAHVVGSILDLLTKSWEEIRPYLVETRLGPDGRFEEQVRYPEDACREALTNAIAHRDYSIEGRAIEVFVFDDRLEVRSPGALLSTVTVQGLRSLQGVHQSRNTIIARTLRELGYMREMGEGFRRIFQLMRAHDLVEPELTTDDQSFVVSLRHRSVFSEEDQRWIEAYETFQLERDEEKVLLLGRTGAPLSVQQIMEALDLVDTEDYRALIERLQHKGLLRSLPKKSKQSRTSPRWQVIQPKDANRFYSELIAGAVAVENGGPLRRKHLARMAEFLSADSPYVPDRLAFTLRRLGLTDSTEHPAGRLRVLLDGDTAASTRPGPRRLAPARRPPGGRTDSETAQSPSSSLMPSDEMSAAKEVSDRREPTKLFVGNLSFDTTESSVRSIFEPLGDVASLSMPSPTVRNSHVNRGYCFVQMVTEAAAKNAKESLEGTILDGRAIFLDWAKS